VLSLDCPLCRMVWSEVLAVWLHFTSSLRGAALAYGAIVAALGSFFSRAKSETLLRNVSSHCRNVVFMAMLSGVDGCGRLAVGSPLFALGAFAVMMESGIVSFAFVAYGTIYPYPRCQCRTLRAFTYNVTILLMSFRNGSPSSGLVYLQALVANARRSSTLTRGRINGPVRHKRKLTIPDSSFTATLRAQQGRQPTATAGIRSTPESMAMNTTLRNVKIPFEEVFLDFARLKNKIPARQRSRHMPSGAAQ